MSESSHVHTCSTVEVRCDDADMGLQQARQDRLASMNSSERRSARPALTAALPALRS